MARRWTPYDRMSRREGNSLHKLLGELEVEVMEHMWRLGEATVRDISMLIQQERPAAYTTVMTVMAHLAEKGLLTRRSIDKKTHLYTVALTREEFLARSSRRMVEAMLEDFGDLALATFLEAVEQAGPEHMERLRKRLQAPKTKA